MKKTTIETKEIPAGVKSPSEIQAAIKKETEKLEKRFLETTIENEIANKPKKTQKTIPTKSIVPFNNTQRPIQPNKTQKAGSLVIAEILAPQLGTDPLMRAKLQNDELKMGVLDMPILLSSLHFLRRGREDHVGYYTDFFSGLIRGTVGINGRGRKDVLQMASNISGSSVTTIATKPNLIARNTFRRNWEKDAEKKGQIVEE